MSNNATMHAKDAIAGALGECFITIDGQRYNFMQVINLKAELETEKTEVSIMGKTGKGNKKTGCKGTGSATFHYNTSIFRELAERFQKTGEDYYFEIQVTNEDPTSSAGRQTTVLEGCNNNKIIVAYIDAGGEILEDEFDFTFESFRMPEKFNVLEGMM